MGLRELLNGVRWGVHPHDDHKRPAADVPLRVMPLPARLCVPLLQHVGAPALPVVAVGERVLRGQLIAAAQGNVSAPVHAPSSGVISAIGEVTAPHPSGLPFSAITIELDGKDEAGEPLTPQVDPFSLAPAEVSQHYPSELRMRASSASAARPSRRPPRRNWASSSRCIP